MGSFAMSSREIERGVSLCRSTKGAGFMEAESVHADRSARPSDVIDERPGVHACDLRDPFERPGENRSGLLTSDIPTGEHECPHLRGLQGEAFELAVADALVARQHDPAVPARFGKPDFVRSALGETVGEALNGRPRVAQSAYNRKAVERPIDKERDWFKRL